MKKGFDGSEQTTIGNDQNSVSARRLYDLDRAGRSAAGFGENGA